MNFGKSFKKNLHHICFSQYLFTNLGQQTDFELWLSLWSGCTVCRFHRISAHSFRQQHHSLINWLSACNGDQKCIINTCCRAYWLEESEVWLYRVSSFVREIHFCSKPLTEPNWYIKETALIWWKHKRNSMTTSY